MIRKALVVITWKPDSASPAARVLLLKVIPKRGSFWQPVTGGIDEGESFDEGALREAQEETGFRFERIPQYLGLEFTFAGREGKTVQEKAYLLPLVGGSAPPEPRLDPKEHDAFQWVTPEEALKLAKFEGNREAISRATTDMPPLYLSRSGFFVQEGEEISHERTALLLHRSLKKAGKGYLVRIGQEEVDVVVEDVPRFVRSFDSAEGTITLSTDEKELLDPLSLRVRSDNSFVCRCSEGLEAVFLRPAYYELTKNIREESGKFLLHFLGRDYNLSVPA